jgi:hypothetical protein
MKDLGTGNPPRCGTKPRFQLSTICPPDRLESPNATYSIDLGTGRRQRRISSAPFLKFLREYS